MHILSHDAPPSLVNTLSEEASLTDVMVLAGSLGRKPAQPGTAYPYRSHPRSDKGNK